MDVGGIPVHLVEHGSGLPVLVLHGAFVDHREAEAGFEPGLARDGIRRLYPDLPGMGRTPAPDSIASAADVLELLVRLLQAVAPTGPVLVAGHSAGAHYAIALAARLPDRVAGMALVCPLLQEAGAVPPHEPVIEDPGLGDEGFRDYFVVQTPAMLARYEEVVAPAITLADGLALARIGERWALPEGEPFPGPALVVAGRRDASVGFEAATRLAARLPDATLAVLDDAGHALPHEQPDRLAALLSAWLDRAIS